MKIRHKILVMSLVFALVAIFFTIIVNFYMISFANAYVFDDVSALPSSYTVIVPGAKVYQNTVSHVVRDRLEAACECVEAGKAEKVLISGDHGRKTYDEVNQLKNFMSQVYGTNEKIIFTDHAGFSTYETMYRARDIFLVNDAIICTQETFAARSVYIERKLGLNAVAFKSKEITPFSRKIHVSWKIRKSLARVKAFFSVAFEAKPRFLGEEIPITGSAEKSWD